MQVDTPGVPFAIASDGQGHHLITSAKGREAAYLLGPEHAAGESLEAVGFTGPPGSPIALGPGRFALVLPERKNLVTLTYTAQAPVGERLSIGARAELDVVPAGLAPGERSVWMTARYAPEDEGLLEVMPETGAVRHRYTTGPVPIDLFRLGAHLVVTAQAEPPRENQLLVLDLKAPDAPPRVVDVPGGMPTWVVPHPQPGWAWVARRGETTLLRLDLERGVMIPGDVGLGLLPQRLTTQGSTLWALDARGEVARFVVSDEGQMARMARVKVAPGATEMALAESGLFVLERERLVWLDRESLEQKAELALPIRSGRMAHDAERKRLIITLPGLQEVAVVGYGAER